MCTTCGCDTDQTPLVSVPGEAGRSAHAHGSEAPHRHDHAHGHPHVHEHSHSHSHTEEHDPEASGARRVRVEQDVLAKNDRLAERNRGWLAGRGISAWNLMSAPGAGKTTLLERSVRDLAGRLDLAVIEGDQATLRDAERIQAAGGRVVQVNTGTGCHLDAAMLADALERLDPVAGSVLVIENVGNLVCPALFDLGESTRAVLVSVTEGEDKPIKYPHMFRAADVMILNKIDLLPYVPFDADRCVAWALQVNPRLEVLRVSALTGEGLGEWYARLGRGGDRPRADRRA